MCTRLWNKTAFWLMRGCSLGAPLSYCYLTLRVEMVRFHLFGVKRRVAQCAVSFCGQHPEVYLVDIRTFEHGLPREAGARAPPPRDDARRQHLQTFRLSKLLQNVMFAVTAAETACSGIPSTPFSLTQAHYAPEPPNSKHCRHRSWMVVAGMAHPPNIAQQGQVQPRRHRR